jgi:hypothetical protein
MKKILLFITAITFLITACEKDGANSKQAEAVQVDPNAAKYAELANNAVVNFLNTDKINNSGKDDDKKDKDDKDDKKDKDDKGKDKLKTKDFKISGTGAIKYIPNGCGTGTLKFTSKGEAKSNLLGNVDQKTSFCLDAVTQQILTVPSGTAEDCDGNVLNYSLAGMGIDAATGFTYQVYTITGGKGDYKKATGTMTLLYHVFTPTNFAYTGKGTMTF